MDMKGICILVAALVLLISLEAAIVLGDDNGENSGNGIVADQKGNKNEVKNKGYSNNNNENGNYHKGDDDKDEKGGDDKDHKGGDHGKGQKGGDDGGNHKGDNGKGKEKDKGNKGKDNDHKKKPDLDPEITNYDVLTPSAKGSERAFCKAKGACHLKTLECPAECPERRPKKNKKHKGCFVHCGSKCEATCKRRRPNCNGYGSLCYDPRFVGGDGVMFYFHGAKGGNFAIVSDENLQINAHFIGTRPQGRTRDFTWVQALSIMFDTHTLVIAAKRVSKWDKKVDALIINFDRETVEVPTDGEAEWRKMSEGREVVVERTDDANSVSVRVSGLAELNIKVRPIGKEENRVHNYQLPEDDAFAHLETQFRFSNLSDNVEGVLGKTYRPSYESPVKVGVPMPIMGGEDKYETPSLYSPMCKVCRFQRRSGIASS